MAKKTTTTTSKPIVTIYTNKNCGYCTTTKDKFSEKEVEFIEKESSEYANEWNEVSRLTGLPTFPTIKFNNEYYIPGRDFNNPDQIVDYIKEWDSNNEIKQSNDVKLLEAFKTLTFTLNRSFARLQQDLEQLKNQEYTITKTQENNQNPQNVNKSTD